MVSLTPRVYCLPNLCLIFCVDPPQITYKIVPLIINFNSLPMCKLYCAYFGLPENGDVAFYRAYNGVYIGTGNTICHQGTFSMRQACNSFRKAVVLAEVSIMVVL